MNSSKKCAFKKINVIFLTIGQIELYSFPMEFWDSTIFGYIFVNNNIYFLKNVWIT